MAATAGATRWGTTASLRSRPPISLVSNGPSGDLKPPAGPLTSGRPPAPPPGNPPGALDRSLAAIVADQIIPRLMMAHQRVVEIAIDGAAPVTSDDIDALVPLALGGDPGGVLAQIERAYAGGLSLDAIMVDLLAPAARRLGTLWEEDRCDFVEVTMGLWRLQEAVREVSTRFGSPFGILGNFCPRRALFAALPGDQHQFGAMMVGEMFRRHGWDTDTIPGATMAELLGQVVRHYYHVVGLTVSCDCHSAQLPSAILSLRSVSCNPHIRIIIGGRLLVENPSLAVEVGADGTAPDAREALVLAEALVDAAQDDAIALA